MIENTQIKVLFVSLFIIFAIAYSQFVDAAISLSPQVPGYGGGNFSARSGSYGLNAANDGYIKNATVNVGGKPITVPATMRMASNAGQYLKNALRTTPYGLLTTAAATLLLSGGIDFDALGNPRKSIIPVGSVPVGSIYPSNWPQPCTTAHSFDTGSGRVETQVCLPSLQAGWDYLEPSYNPSGVLQRKFSPYTSGCTSTINGDCVPPAYAPATQADFDALPDPLPALFPELPYAPYLPDGVPVNPPEYSFTPFSAPIGNPYTRPDGSTVQPSATVSPNGDTVTIDTFDKPLTDSAGNPVPTAAPQDTPEPAPEQKTQCEKFPASLGCANLDIPTAQAINKENFDIDLISPVTVGGSGSCPAPMTANFLGQNVEVAFTPLCIFADTLRPLVLAIAWLSAGLIFIGGVRNG